MGAEGPIVTRDGRIFMVASATGSILEVFLAQSIAREFVNTGGIPAGLQVDENNDLWLADMKLGILRISLDGIIFPEITQWENKPIRGCNDLSINQEGDLYFTAPAGSDLDHPEGEIFCRSRNRTVSRLDGGFAFCNGIAISPDGTHIIVAETSTKRLWSYDIPQPGVALRKKLWATLLGDHVGGPDGIDFDRSGRLVAANWGEGHLEIFSPLGDLIQRIPVPFDHPSNLHFLNPSGDQCQILITEHTSNGLWIADYHG